MDMIPVICNIIDILSIYLLDLKKKIIRENKNIFADF